MFPVEDRRICSRLYKSLYGKQILERWLSFIGEDLKREVVSLLKISALDIPLFPQLSHFVTLPGDVGVAVRGYFRS